MSHDYVPRMINLERSDYQIVRQMAEERGLGEKGLSAAIRMIIRDWQEFQLQYPNRMTAEEIQRVLVELVLIVQSAVTFIHEQWMKLMTNHRILAYAGKALSEVMVS
jgi:hypothetical protein